MLARPYEPSPEDEAPLDTALRRVERTCEQHHDLVAAIGIGDTLTYAQLWIRARSVAARLVEGGVALEDRVGVWAEQSSDLLVSIVGIWLAGAAYVPLDPKLPAKRLEFLVEDAGLRHVVVPHRALTEAASLGLQLVSSEAGEGDRERSAVLPEVRGDTAAYVIYTSGSTGRPKGVVIEHRSLADLFDRMAADVGGTAGTTFMGAPTPAFDASITYLLYPLSIGGTVVTIESEATRDPYLLADAIARHRPDALLALPAMLRMLVETRWAGAEHMVMWTGGEHTAPDVIEYVVPRVASFYNYYGPTEATVYASVVELGVEDVTAPIARSLAATTCLLLDGDGSPTAQGEVGELFIVGASLARGYLNDPALTAQRFAPIEVDGAQVRAYRTGDRARVREDGALEILGRMDDQINLRGYRIEPHEIEARLVEYPAVLEAVVASRPTPDGDTQLVAFVTTSGPVDATSLREFAGEVLPRHMVPAAVVEVPSLPIGSSGKVDRKALAASLDVTPAPSARATAPVGADDTGAAGRIAAIFASVLSLDPSLVGADQDFYDLGGTSLKSLRLFLLIEEELGVHLPLSTLATASTPSQLAELLEGRGTRRRGEAPRHEWERILNGLWSDELGGAHLARDDSFFGLGGTTEGAARMLRELRGHYGVDISLEEFAASPTIMDLAALVGRRTQRSILVPLTTSGTGTPIFFIAGAGGLAITFLPLARLLGPEQVCYGIQTRGIESRAVPDVTLDQGARRYARAIREVQPHGPYLIGGHSLGGVHALKVAQLLEAEGEEVALLVIFDTPLSRGMVGRRAERRRRTAGRPVVTPSLPKLTTVLHLPVVGIVPLKGTDQFEAFAALGELQAMLARRLKPWAGRTTLFLSDEEEAAQIETRWGRVLTGSWTSAKVPGGHIAMLEKENIGVAATILHDQIERALAACARPAPAPGRTAEETSVASA